MYTFTCNLIFRFNSFYIRSNSLKIYSSFQVNLSLMLFDILGELCEIKH